MAFTEGEKYKIIRFLGWNGGTLDPSSIHYSKNVVDKLERVTAGAEAEAREILEKIIALENKQTSSVAQAGVKKVDDIEFFENGGSTFVIGKEKRRLINELANLLGIPNYSTSSVMGNVCI